MKAHLRAALAPPCSIRPAVRVGEHRCQQGSTGREKEEHRAVRELTGSGLAPAERPIWAFKASQAKGVRMASSG
jgi:hypothetical protein